MSSDEDATPSLEKDANKRDVPSPSSGLRRRFRLFRQKKKAKEGTVTTADLQDIYSVTSGVQHPTSDTSSTSYMGAIESGVDVLDTESHFRDSSTEDNKILDDISEQIANIEVDEERVLNMKELTGSEAREKFYGEDTSVTVFAPVGFVDMRDYVERRPVNYR